MLKMLKSIKGKSVVVGKLMVLVIYYIFIKIVIFVIIGIVL